LSTNTRFCASIAREKSLPEPPGKCWESLTLWFAGERGISVFPDYTDKELETELRAGRQAMQSAKRKRRKRA